MTLAEGLSSYEEIRAVGHWIQEGHILHHAHFRVRGLGIGIICVTTVSYTHLDVYKRQHTHTNITNK